MSTSRHSINICGINIVEGREHLWFWGQTGEIQLSFYGLFNFELAFRCCMNNFHCDLPPKIQTNVSQTLILLTFSSTTVKLRVWWVIYKAFPFLFPSLFFLPIALWLQLAHQVCTSLIIMECITAVLKGTLTNFFMTSVHCSGLRMAESHFPRGRITSQWWHIYAFPDSSLVK